MGSAGTGDLLIGSDAEVGAIWSAGRIDLRDRAKVHGDVSSAVPVTLGNNVVIDGVTTVGPMEEALPITLEAPEGASGNNVTLEPNQTLTLPSGIYGNLLVKAGAKLRVSGTYRFGSVIFDSGSKIEVLSVCESARIHALSSLIFRGQVIEQPDTPAGTGLKLAYHGMGSAHIETPFVGEVFAPKAEVIVSAGTHRGRFFAKGVRLQSDVHLLGPDSADTGPAACTTPVPAPPPAPPVVSLGPVPPLSSASDLPQFLEWFYRIREGEKGLAGAAIARVAHDDGVAGAVITELNVMRAQVELGPALMLMTLLGALDAPVGNAFLLNLLAQALPPEPATLEEDAGGGITPFLVERGIRSVALQYMKHTSLPNADSVLLAVVLNHTDGSLRRTAALAYLSDKSDAERVNLRAQLPPEDAHIVDVVSVHDPNFAQRMDEYMQAYGQ